MKQHFRMLFFYMNGDKVSPDHQMDHHYFYMQGKSGKSRMTYSQMIQTVCGSTGGFKFQAGFCLREKYRAIWQGKLKFPYLDKNFLPVTCLLQSVTAWCFGFTLPYCRNTDWCPSEIISGFILRYSTAAEEAVVSPKLVPIVDAGPESVI